MTGNILDLLEPISSEDFHRDYYTDTQMGYEVEFIKHESELLSGDFDLVILGCEEYRGDLKYPKQEPIIRKIREEFYNLENWHNIKIADIGNVKKGLKPYDTYAALTAVAEELIPLRAKVLVLGGSDDLTYALYKAYAQLSKIIEVSVVDSHVDFTDEPSTHAYNYLKNILLEEPNYTRHLSVIGFQSYFVPPNLLQVLDNLRFDFIRLGRLKENITLGEPLLRSSEVISLDMKSIAHPYHQYADYLSPNGFDGAEVCSFMRFAGMSDTSKFIGCYNAATISERWDNSALLVAQMMWYTLEGINLGKSEAPFEDTKAYMNFTVETGDKSFEFKKSKRTSRWWINIQNEDWLPCNYEDYREAAEGNIPERWLRAMEK